jgi:hypothetical protein
MPHAIDENLVLLVLRLDNLAHEWPHRRDPVSENPKALMCHVEDLKGLRKMLLKMPPRHPYCAVVHFQWLILISPYGR